MFCKFHYMEGLCFIQLWYLQYLINFDLSVYSSTVLGEISVSDATVIFFPDFNIHMCFDDIANGDNLFKNLLNVSKQYNILSFRIDGDKIHRSWCYRWSWWNTASSTRFYITCIIHLAEGPGWCYGFDMCVWFNTFTEGNWLQHLGW